MRPLIDLAGRRFGRMTVIERHPINSGRMPRWRCQCDCGNESVVQGGHLRYGHVKSCGCARMENGRAHADNLVPGGSKTHGLTNHRMFNLWCQMRARCYNPRHHAYENYGGRGITICDRWRLGEGRNSGFECFLADMVERPEGKSLDRYPDPDGDYEHGNCRWATPKEQANNRRPRKAA